MLLYIIRSYQIRKYQNMKKNTSRRIILILMAAVMAILATACPPNPGTIPDDTTSTTVATTTPTTTPPVSDNLILNPSLEDGSGNVVDHWAPGGYGANGATWTVSSDAHTGTRAGTITSVGYGDGDGKWIFDPVSVTPGKTYTFGTYYRSTAATQLDYVLTSTTGVDSYFWLADLAPASSWTQATGSFTIPAGTAKVTVYHILSSNGSLTIDDVSLRANTATGTTTTTALPTSTTIPGSTTTSTTLPTTTTTPTTGHPAFSRALVTIECDDGYQSCLNVAQPMAKTYGYDMTQYIITKSTKDCETGYMCAANVLTWISRGGQIGSHTVDHHSLTTVEPNNKLLTAAQVKTELADSQTYLTTLTGVKPVLLATPYCDYNPSVTTVAKQYYRGIRNCDDNVITAATWDPYNFRSFQVHDTTTVAEIQAALAQAQATNGWVNFTFHEFGPPIDPSAGTEYTYSAAQFTAFLNAVKASKIPVVTTLQAFNEASGLG